MITKAPIFLVFVSLPMIRTGTGLRPLSCLSRNHPFMDLSLTKLCNNLSVSTSTFPVDFISKLNSAQKKVDERYQYVRWDLCRDANVFGPGRLQTPTSHQQVLSCCSLMVCFKFLALSLRNACFEKASWRIGVQVLCFADAEVRACEWSEERIPRLPSNKSLCAL